MYRAAKRAAVLPRDPDLAFCYDMLNRVSRSFAVVIQQLPPQLRDAVCVFYLVLRALDTVEDDMALEERVKVPLLRAFYAESREDGWSMDCGSGDYCRLMQHYPRVAASLARLEPSAQDVIDDICHRMGDGMADFITQEVESVEQYNLYCHYVAGLVGIGLSQLFAASKLEDDTLTQADSLSNHMALLLQKTNIIRDYLVRCVCGVVFCGGGLGGLVGVGGWGVCGRGAVWRPTEKAEGAGLQRSTWRVVVARLGARR